MIYNNLFINNKVYDALTQNDEPPTLYSLMNSMINYGAEVQTKIEDLPSLARLVIFDFNYPLNSNLKENFEITFLNHFMMRRIGFETYTAFKIHLKDRLNSIMPKYNKMLEGFNNLNFNGLVESEIRNENGTNENNVDSSVSSSTTTDNRFSDTPQNAIQDVKSGEYLTDYTYNESTNNVLNNTLGNTSFNTDEIITKTKANSIDEYKKFLEVSTSIYDMIFKECECLFFGLL